MQIHLRKISLFIMLFILSSVVQTSAAQELQIRGSVRSEAGDTVEYYHVLLISEDSTFQKMDIFYAADFQISCNYKKPLTLHITSMGYDPVMLPIDAQTARNPLVIAPITLRPQALQAKTVTVLGVRQNVKVKAGNITINPQNTSLGASGTLIGMLRQTPGMRAEGADGFSVIGRGTPLVYVNGRKITEPGELQTIPSENVKNIEVLRNPSAAYSSTASAVVRIKTVTKLEDSFDIYALNTLTFKRKISEAPMLILSLRKGIVTTEAGYSYNFSQDKIFESSNKTIEYSTHTFNNYSDGTQDARANVHKAWADLQLDFDAKNSLNFKYMYSQTASDFFRGDSNFVTDGSSTIKKRIENHDAPLRMVNMVSMNYNHTISSNSDLRIVADYANVSRSGLNTIRELYANTTDSRLTQVDNNSKYNLYTGSVNYNTLFPHDVRFEGGAEFSYVDNRTTTYMMSGGKATSDFTNQNNMIVAPYVSVSREGKFVSFSAGVRYEYATNLVQNNGGNINRHYSNFFPDVSISGHLSKNFELTVGFSRSISRPNYRLLDPSIYYEDSLSYRTGNPLLKPTYDNDITLDFSYKSMLTLSLGYTITQEKKIETYVEDELRPNVLKMTPINIPHSQAFKASLMFNHQIPNWQFYCGVNMTIPNVEITTIDGVRHVNRPSWGVSASVDWTFVKNITLYANFSYDSPSYELTRHNFSYNMLNVGIMGYFFDRQLLIKIEGTDLLNGSNWNNWNEMYRNVITQQRGDFDLTGVALTLRYRLNKKNLSTRTRTGNDSVLQRTN